MLFYFEQKMLFYSNCFIFSQQFVKDKDKGFVDTNFIEVDNVKIDYHNYTQISLEEKQVK